MQWNATESFYGNARQPPELRHWGIKGQKWGIRRFQEENGSYTEEGKVRYGLKSESSLSKDQARGKATRGLAKSMDANQPKDYSKEDRKKWKAKDVNNLSDDELKKRNNRLQAEQNYKNNMTSQTKKDAKQFAKNVTQEAIKNIFIGTAVTALAAVMAKNYKKVGPVIARAGKTLYHNIKDHRNVIKDSANVYSRSKVNKSSRNFEYRPGSNYGFGVAKDWPTVNTRGNKSGKNKNTRR